MSISILKFVLQRKDESIVQLTNELHELELNHVQANAVVAAAAVLNQPSASFQNSASSGQAQSAASVSTNSNPSAQSEPIVPFAGSGLPTVPPIPLPPVNKSPRLNGGMSFDSDKCIFREFVEVGVQTTPKGHQSGAEMTASPSW